MKKYIFLTTTVALVIGAAIGWWLAPIGPSQTDSAANAGPDILYWQAPMDPNYRRDEPGKSPMGMDLVPIYATADESSDAGVVAIDSTVANNLGIRTESVEFGALSRRIDTVGYVSYDEDTLHQINTRVEGWVEKLAVKSTGERVQQGQTLLELYSPTLVNAQEEYLATLSSSSASLKQASYSRLVALGISKQDIDEIKQTRKAKQRVRVYATTDGIVAKLNIREGSHIMPSTTIMSIARLDTAWVLAEVFERQADWVKKDQTAYVELDFLPGQSWQGLVDYVYPELNQQTRTLKVRLRFDNPSELLRPNMFARVTIDANAVENVVHVPREAVIRGGATNRVVVTLGNGKYRSQPVELGIESGDRVEIREGLSKNDVVVTSGQFLIDSESNIESALARMADESDAMNSASEMADHAHQENH